MNMVHTVKVNTKLFTEKDLQISKMYINSDVYPGLYDNTKLPKTFQYQDRKLIKLKEIGNLVDVFNQMDEKGKQNFYHGLSQDSLIRLMGRGANADEVIANIIKFGYELSHLPISVALCPDGNVYSLDGRTRIEGLEKLNFENAIVDFYICKSWPEFFRQAILRNPPITPRSPMTMADVINYCNGNIKHGWLKREYSDILAQIHSITDGKMKKETMDKVIQNVLHGTGFSAEVVSMSEEKAKKWLKINGYHDNENNNGIYYKVVASSAWSKAIASSANTLIDELLAEGNVVKELRIVIHTGTLSGADPSKSWKDKIDQFRKGWKENLKNIENGFFHSNKRKSVIKLYGAIPAVADLSYLYPTDKLVMFHVGQLKTKTFDEIDTELALDQELVV